MDIKRDKRIDNPTEEDRKKLAKILEKYPKLKDKYKAL